MQRRGVRLVVDDGQTTDDLWIDITKIHANDCFAGHIHDVEADGLQGLVGRDIMFHANHIVEIIDAAADAMRR